MRPIADHPVRTIVQGMTPFIVRKSCNLLFLRRVQVECVEDVSMEIDQPYWGPHRVGIDRYRIDVRKGAKFSCWYPPFTRVKVGAFVPVRHVLQSLRSERERIGGF